MSKNRRFHKVDMSLFREQERGELLRKYFDLFYSKIKIEGDLTNAQKDYLIRQLYFNGHVCITKRVGDHGPLICPYAPVSWNNEDYPVEVQYINHRGIPNLFPKKMTGINGEDCVIGFIRPCHQSIDSYVKHAVEKIVDLSVTIRINTIVQRLPFMVGTTPADKLKMQTIINELEDGQLAIFADLNDLNQVKAFTGAPFNIDKLRAEKESLENELKTQLGINNNNNIKKERMLVDEVNANNDEIETSSNVYMTPLQAFSEELSEVLGFNINIEWEAPLAYEGEQYEEEETNDESIDE